MEKENPSINLLGDKGRRASDILLEWALYIGRMLVILTETIALIVFVSRFSLDRRLIDLNDTIKNQQAFVVHFKQGEETFRNTQLKLAVSRINTASSSAVVNLFNEIIEKTDNQLTLTAINVSPSSMTVTAQASSADILSSFTQQIKLHPLVTSVSVDKVASKPKSSLVSITVTAQLRRQK
jgi:hypothetical protein